MATHYYYDSIGQLTNTVYSDGTPSIAIAYNRLGQKTQVIDASGTNTFAYSDMLQLTNETVQVSGFTSQLSRSYDSLGRSSGISLSDPSSPSYAVQYSYDDLGRFSSVSSSVASVSSVVNYSRLDGSDLISGYTTDSGLAVSYSFEDNRNNKTQVLNRFGTNVISQFDYTYDALNRRTQRTDLRPLDLGLSTNVFAYNSRSELTSAVMSTNDYSYAYDSIGNRVDATSPSRSLSYVANELNQYTQTTDNSSTNNYTYDADGNLLSDGMSTYTWNGENRLVKVEPLICTNGSLMVQFAYDFQGRRISKKVSDFQSSVWNLKSQTQFVYDGWNLIADICSPTSGTSSTNLFVWGLDLSGTLQGAGGVGGLLSVTVAGGGDPGPFFPCYDANGNVTDYVSTNGTIAAHFAYDAFGNTTSESIAQGLEPKDFSVRFSTKYFDTETALYYYGFRYYNPEMGRWLNRDPIEESGGINIYSMLRNNLNDKVDLFGLSLATTCTGLVGGDASDANRADLKDAIERLKGLKHEGTAIPCFNVVTSGTDMPYSDGACRTDAQKDGSLDDAIQAVQNGDSIIWAHGSPNHRRFFGEDSLYDGTLINEADKNGNQCSIYGCYSPRNPDDQSILNSDLAAIIAEMNGMECNDKCTTETFSVVIGPRW